MLALDRGEREGFLKVGIGNRYEGAAGKFRPGDAVFLFIDVRAEKSRDEHRSEFFLVERPACRVPVIGFFSRSADRFRCRVKIGRNYLEGGNPEGDGERSGGDS